MRKEKSNRFQSLSPPKKTKRKSHETLRSSNKAEKASSEEQTTNLKESSNFLATEKVESEDKPTEQHDFFSFHRVRQIEQKKEQIEKARTLLSSDSWFVKNGHLLTYVGLYVFSILVWFRPYELVSSLGFLAATAFYVALATLLIFIPAQIFAEGSLTTFPIEVKCMIALVALALITMFIGKSFERSWQTFNDSFSKAAIMFVVMVNVLRTRRRLLGMLFLSLSIGVIVSLYALSLYLKGEFKVEGYRVGLEIGGMFGNPNDMALHLVTMLPIAFCLAFAARSFLPKTIFFLISALFIAGIIVTFSRGAFLGLLVSSMILAWKLGKKYRFKIFVGFLLISQLFILLAPSNYFLRLFSIFAPELDPVGSADQRRGLFLRSLYVTARNPWGIGIGNSAIMNDYNLEWHNTYMQIASELGILALLIYLIFLISPLKRLSAVEKIQEEESDWFYYLSVGLQASIIAYMVSSFFVSVAYNWYVYYLIAYAVALRRVYRVEKVQ